jgi:hypothetical protein
MITRRQRLDDPFRQVRTCASEISGILIVRSQNQANA